VRGGGGPDIEPRPEWLEEAECFRCRLSGREIYRLPPFAVVRCPRCDQVFVSPRLNQAGRLALYGDPAYFDDGVYGTPQASFLQRRWAGGRLTLIEQAADGSLGRDLFEIGCAYGLFLAAARRRGFTVGGLEFSPMAARTASQWLGCPIEVGEIERMERSVEADVVAFWDVIEHVPDPAEFLGAVGGILRSGGLIALSCPSFDSVPARLLGSRWWTLKPHKHIWHFTTAGILRLLREQGLEPVEVARSPLRSANLSRLDSLVVVARKPA